MATEEQLDKAIGPSISTLPAAHPDKTIPMRGTYITLTLWNQSYVPSLWQHFSVDPSLFIYTPFPDLKSEDHLRTEFADIAESNDPICYVVLGDPSHLNPRPTNLKSTTAPAHIEALGLVFYGHVSTESRAIEIGAFFAPALQRTAAATEVHYLLLKNVLDEDSPVLGGDSPPYRRVSWKCNALNERSRRAALRVGYVFEGTNRQMQIVRGRSRDEDTFSILDEEWKVRREAMESWLEESNWDAKGRPKTRLQDLRRDLKR